MHERNNAGFVAGLMLLAAAAMAAAEPSETRAWSDYLIPLPQEMAVTGTVRLAPGQLGLAAAPDASAMVMQAVNELRAAWQARSGQAPTGAEFVIQIGLLDEQGRLNGQVVAGADRLKQARYPAQAYLIRPIGSNSLAVAGLADPGVFYGIQTLTRLLTARLTSAAAEIPLAEIYDWPDMDQRGVWNTSIKTPGFIPWMASLKLNFSHVPTGLILKQDAPAECPPLPMDLIRDAAGRAFLLMPHMPHYDYLFRYGADELYPELTGKGDGARNPCYKWGGSFARARCPCMATPLLQRIAKEWIESAAAQGAREVSLWLSERAPCQCECAECMKDGPRQFQKETQASVAAILAAREKYPDLQGRVFFTLSGGEEGVQVSKECLAMLPPEIKAEKVYTANAAFDKYAADGHWLATYDGPRVGPGYWTLRYEIDAIKKSVDKYLGANYSALYCLSRGPTVAAPEKSGEWEREFGNFQYAALAEWTWNAGGRSPREFAKAWAVGNQAPAPARFAEWFQVMEPVTAFLREATYTAGSGWVQAAVKICGADVQAAWPAGLAAPEEIQRLLDVCARALPLAEQSGDACARLETIYAQKFLQALAQFQALHRLCMADGLPRPERVRQLQAAAQSFDDAAAALDRAYRDILKIAATDYQHGPQRCAERHDAWTGALRDQVKKSLAAWPAAE